MCLDYELAVINSKHFFEVGNLFVSCLVFITRVLCIAILYSWFLQFLLNVVLSHYCPKLGEGLIGYSQTRLTPPYKLYVRVQCQEPVIQWMSFLSKCYLLYIVYFQLLYVRRAGQQTGVYHVITLDRHLNINYLPEPARDFCCCNNSKQTTCHAVSTNGWPTMG